MVLYQAFADYYDEIFPPDQDTITFLTTFFQRGKLLDIGCGTGSYALSLAKMGYPVTACDLDAAMVGKAKRKATDSPVDFSVKNMLSMDEFERYVGIYCIGNTLVHLDSSAEILLAMTKMYQALVPGGKLVVQILNYDRILDFSIKSLPTVVAGEISFERNYERTGLKILFSTRLKVPGRVFEASLSILPIRSEMLFGLLKKAGFTEIRLRSGFTDFPFQPRLTFALVATALRPKKSPEKIQTH
jgi:glycine/sarcosine N-methyltransferase